LVVEDITVGILRLKIGFGLDFFFLIRIFCLVLHLAIFWKFAEGRINRVEDFLLIRVFLTTFWLRNVLILKEMLGFVENFLLFFLDLLSNVHLPRVFRDNL
jgi:hypothetical protein